MSNTKRMVLATMFLALGLVLPFAVAQIPVLGAMLLPMHIPILLCGLICGWQYGGLVGFICPLLRSALFGMPMMFPNAIAMAFELMTYGAVIGLLWERSKYQCLRALFRCMIPAMIIGRVVWGIVSWALFAIAGTPFTLELFLAGAFINAVPGIILQFLLIPTIMLSLQNLGVIEFNQSEMPASN